MPERLSDEEYERFRSLILIRTGLDFPPPRRDDFNAWLIRALDMMQDTVRYHSGTARRQPIPTTLPALYDALASGHQLAWDTVVDALTVCETHFFRNMSQFEVLQDHFLPALIAERRQQGNLSLSLWSAGCASGEEAYSLAILIRELLPDWRAWKLNIVGTDINKRSLEQARQAVYRDWSFREAYAQVVRDRYFSHHETRYQLHDDVRAMVRFEECSLTDSCPTVPDGQSGVDVIFCRNVILYFGKQVRGWVYQRLRQALSSGGWLLVGHADPPPPPFTALETLHFRGTTVYRKPGSAPPPPEPAAAPVHAFWDDDLAPEPLILPDPPEMDGADRHGAEVQYRLGRWHANRQHWDEALYYCRQATELAPTYTEAYYTLALIYQSTGNQPEAIDALRQAIYLDRQWALPRFTLADLYRTTGQPDKARRELRNVIAITGRMPPDTPIAGGDGLTAARLRDAAERQLERSR